MSWFGALLPSVVSNQFTLSKLTVKYNATDFAYPSSFGWSDLGTVRAFSKMIEGCTICQNTYLAATNFNTGLAYDVSTDNFISKNYGPQANEFFTRAAVKAACALAIGNIPTLNFSSPGSGNQGIAYDPINSIIFEYLGTAGNTYIRERDLAGNLLDEVDTDLGISYIPGTIWYDYITEIMYFTTGGVTNTNVTGLKKNAGGTLWETVDTKWYITKEGIGGINGSFIANMIGSASAGTNTLVRWQDIDGFKVRLMATPSSFVNYEEGTIIDPRDLTIWYNEDTGGHASVVNGNRLLHVDNPNGYYLKYLRFPNMFPWSDCKLNGNTVTGDFYPDEVLTGNNWTTLPVIDYGANTAQQTLANWEVGEDEAAELEFRGSGTAPTTSPLSAKDWHTLAEYDPNGTNDGWGSTTPSAWQSTPTTDRYMQVRVKPISPTPLWTPADLGTDLLFWSEHQSLDGLYYDPTDSNRCEVAINYVDPSNNLSNPTAGQKPTWNSAGRYLDMTASSRLYQLSSGTVDMLKALSECEVHAVAQKNAGSSRVIFLGVSQISSDNYQIRLQHLGSGMSPANSLSIHYIDSAGAASIYGITDTLGISNWRMVTFRLGGSSNKIYVNNVEQTLSVSSGSNSGQCFDDISAGMNTGRIARISASTAVSCAQKQRGIIITKHLSDANRELLVDYMQRVGMID